MFRLTQMTLVWLCLVLANHVTAQPQITTLNDINLGEFEGRRAILIDIHLPIGADSAQFIDNYERVQKEQRKPALAARDACTQFDDTRVFRSAATHMATGEPCTNTLKLAVTLGRYPAISMYAIARPTSGNGALIFPSYFLANTPGSGLTVKITSPEKMYAQGFGQIASNGASLRRELSHTATIEALQKSDTAEGQTLLGVNGYVYIGPEKPQLFGELAVLRDSNVSDLIYEPLIDASTKMLEITRQGFGRSVGRQIGFTILLTENASDIATTWKGDVDPRGDIVLDLTNSNGRPTADTISSWRELVAHEFVHLYNGGSETLSTDHRNPWLHEGGADFLMLPALMQLGYLSDARLIEKLDQSLNSCLAAAENLVWANDKNKWAEQKPYNCGALFHLIAWREIQLKDPSAKILPTWGRYWRQESEQSVASFIKFFQVDGLAPGIQPLTLSDVAAPELGPLLRAELNRLGLPLTVLDPKSPSNLNRVASLYFRDLVGSDCNSWGFSISSQAVFQISDSVQCKTLAPSEKINRVEGVDPISEPFRAFELARNACEKNQKVNIGRIDQTSFPLSCSANWVPKPVAPIYQFDRAALLQSLKAGS
jgi:hypothetical protein